MILVVCAQLLVCIAVQVSDFSRHMKVISILLSSDVEEEHKELAGRCCDQVFIADPCPSFSGTLAISEIATFRM